MPRGFYPYYCFDCGKKSHNCPEGCCRWCGSENVVPEQWALNPLAYSGWRQRLQYRPERTPILQSSVKRSLGIGVDLTQVEPMVYFTGAKRHWPPRTESEYLTFLEWSTT